MEQTYLVFIVDRGWWSKASGYVSEIKDAKEFQHEEALAFCRKRYAPGSMLNQVGAFPVSTADLVEISVK